jgi:hypothetical protein
MFKPMLLMGVLLAVSPARAGGWLYGGSMHLLDSRAILQADQQTDVEEKQLPIGDNAVGTYVPIDADASEPVSPYNACIISADKEADILKMLRECRNKRVGWLKI